MTGEGHSPRKRAGRHRQAAAGTQAPGTEVQVLVLVDMAALEVPGRTAPALQGRRQLQVVLHHTLVLLLVLVLPLGSWR